MKCLSLLLLEYVHPDLFRILLFDVAATGNAKVAACLARTCPNADRKEAMRIAAKHKQIFIIKTLLKSTDDLDFKIAIILAAAEQVDLEAMAPLLDLRDNLEYTVLHSAARALRYRDVVALLSAGANPDTVGHEESSIIEDMLKKQNDLYRQVGDAASVDISCIEIAALLLDSGATINPSLTSLLISFVTKEQDLNQKPDEQHSKKQQLNPSLNIQQSEERKLNQSLEVHQSQEQPLNPSSDAQQSYSFTKRMQFYFKCLFHPRHLGKLNRLTYLNLLVPILAQNQISTLQLLVEYAVHYLNINPNKRTPSFRLVDNLNERSDSPQKRFESPGKSPSSPLRKPDSSLKNPDSPQRKPDSPLKSSDSPKSSLFSQQKKSESLQQRFDSPLRKSDSPQSRMDSSQRKSDSPQARMDSSQRKPDSPQSRMDSPLRKPDSPQARMDSPQRKSDPAPGISNKPPQDDNTYYDLINMCLQKGHFECAKLLLEQGISSPIKIRVAQLKLMEGIRELLIAKEFQQLVNLLPRLDAQQEQEKKHNEDQNPGTSASLQTPTAL